MQIAPITKMIYPPRQCGQFLIALAGCIYVYDVGMSPWFYVLGVLSGILWPIISLWIAAHVSHVKTYEILCLTYLDSYLVAIWAPICSFSLWYVVFIISGMGMALISIGGWRMFFKGIFSILCSFMTVGLLMYLFSDHFMVSMPTPLLGIVASSIGTICFAYVVASNVYVRSIRLKKTRLQLYETNNDVLHVNQIMKIANSSLNIEEMLDNVSVILKELFDFDFISIQIYDKDKQNFKIYAVGGSKFNQYLLKAIKHVHLRVENEHAFLDTIFNGQPYYHVDNINEHSSLPLLEAELYKIRPFLSMATFPLTLDQEGVGIMSFYSSRASAAFDDKLLNKMKIYVANLTTVINNATLFGKLKRSQDAIHRKNEELANLSNKLSHYLAPQIYESIFSGERDVKIEAKRKQLTVFFSDIAGFTELTDRIESEVLTSMLNTYLTRMTAIAVKYGGTIDKYIGDAILIFFGDPVSKGARKDALDCTLMAVEMRNELNQLKQLWVDEGFSEELNMRMGINTGYCNVGNFGSEYRMDYTIIGSQVNLTSRIQYAANPGEILLAEETYLLVKDKVDCESLEPLTLKGINHPVQAYRVIAIKEPQS